MRNDLAGMAREVEQKLKFLGRQVNWLACDLDAVRSGINDEFSGHDGRLGPLGCAAQDEHGRAPAVPGC